MKFLTTSWLRVSNQRRCPICGHPDWCGVSDDGTAAVCMRIAEGSTRKARNGGYVHQLDVMYEFVHQPSRLKRPPAPPKRNDVHLVAEQYRTALAPNRLSSLSRQLGLSEDSLRGLGVGFSHEANSFTFPMRDHENKVVGIRMRDARTGKKFSLTGGREGVFIPAEVATCPAAPVPNWQMSEFGHLRTRLSHDGVERLCVTEGPTDCAALLDLGCTAIGRPNCTGGVKIIVNIVKRLEPTSVVVFADADGPGQGGASSLANVLRCYVPGVAIVTPPAKDAREWKVSGATAADVEHLIESSEELEGVAR